MKSILIHIAVISSIILSLFLSRRLIEYVERKSMEDIENQIDKFFEDNRSLVNKDIIYWIEKTDEKVPIIKGGDEKETSFWCEYFNQGHEILGYNDEWAIHVILRDSYDGKIIESEVTPEFAYHAVTAIEYDDVEVRDSERSMGEVMVSSVKSRYHRIHRIPSKDVRICGLQDDFGYRGMFASDWNRGLGTERWMYEYKIYNPMGILMLKDYIRVASILIFIFFALIGFCCISSLVSGR